MSIKKSLNIEYEEDNLLIKLKNFEEYGVTVLVTKTNFGDVRFIDKKEISNRLSINNKILISGKQVHSDNVVSVFDDSIFYFDNTDGFITNNKNIALMCKFADCLPITFIDIKNNVFGIVHSGWMGSNQAIILKATEKLKQNFNSDLKNIKFMFGPAISKYNYEVKNDFLIKFKDKFDKNIIDKAFTINNGKIYFDNQLFNFELLKSVGVEEKNIFRNEFCTYDNKNLHSFRRDKESSGRGGTIIYWSNS